MHAKVCAMGRPGIVCGTRDNPGLHRIEMDITKESEEVGVDIDELGLVAPLEKMACRAQRLVPIARVTEPVRNSVCEVG